VPGRCLKTFEPFLIPAYRPTYVLNEFADASKTTRNFVVSCLDAVQRDAGLHSEVDLSQNKEERYIRVPRLSDTRYLANRDMQVAKRD